MINPQNYFICDQRYLVDAKKIREQRQKELLQQFIAERQAIRHDSLEQIEKDLSSAKKSLNEVRVKFPDSLGRISQLEHLISALEKDIRIERYSSWKELFSANCLLCGIRGT